MRWTIRSIGLVSTIILARLLTPGDFGVVAMGMVVVGFLEVFSYTGVDLALIQNTKATREHYDSAWTIQIVQGILLGVLLALIAPLASSYFNEPRTVLVIQILALRAVIGGCQNIGIIEFRKNLDFGKEFRFGVYSKIVTFTITISLAIYLQNYWALVAGMVTGRIMEVMLSYIMHAYRPRLAIKRITELWSFSKWMLVFHVGYYATNKTDEFVVGGLSGTSSMGSYAVGAEVATMPTNELMLPVARALFPNFAKLSNTPKKLAEAYINVLGIVSMLGLPIGLGIAAVANDLVLLVLGEKWALAVPVVQWLAIFGAIATVSAGVGTVLTAMGRVRLLAGATWLQLALLAPAVIIAGISWDFKHIAMARTVVALVNVPVMFYFLTTVIPVRPRQIIAVLWRPAIAAFLMFLVVRVLHDDQIYTPILRLSLDVVTGAVTFALAQLTLWWLSGRPDGTERALLTFVASKLRGPAKT